MEQQLAESRAHVGVCRSVTKFVSKMEDPVSTLYFYQVVPKCFKDTRLAILFSESRGRGGGMTRASSLKCSEAAAGTGKPNPFKMASPVSEKETGLITSIQ